MRGRKRQRKKTVKQMRAMAEAFGKALDAHAPLAAALTELAKFDKAWWRGRFG